jgi:hypothetical protein
MNKILWLLWLWTTTAVAAPVLVNEYRLLPNFTPMMQCDNCRNFTAQNGVLKVKGTGHLWTKDMAYDVSDGTSKVVVEASVQLHNTEIKGMMMGAVLSIGFSENMKAWHPTDKMQDALTFNITCDENAQEHTIVRTQMYRKPVGRSRYILPANQWEKIKIVLSAKELVAYGSDNVELVKVDLSGVEFPKKGYVGILTSGFSRAPFEIKELKISKE